MDLVTVNGLSKRYGGIVALSEAEFAARAGEVHALLGENGAGKSTFIQILSGAVRHDGGTILIDGRDFRPANPDDARARGIAAVFQELSLIPDLTVEQNIWFRHEPMTPLQHGRPHGDAPQDAGTARPDTPFRSCGPTRSCGG